MSKSIATMITQLDAALSDEQQYSKEQVLELFKTLTLAYVYQVPNNKDSKEKKPKTKRAKSAYQFFMGDAEVRKIIKEENTEATSKEILTLMAGKWKGMEDEEKTKYAEMSAQDKETMQKQQPPKAEKKRTRAKTAYQFFMGDAEVRNEVKEENEEASSKEILTLMAGKWKGMEDEEKTKYAEMSEEDKKAFALSPFDVFKGGLSEDEDAQEKWDSMSESEKDEFSKAPVKKKASTVKSPKQSKTALKIYQSNKEVREVMKEENTDSNAKEITKLLSEQWKELTDEEKAPYKAEAEKEKVKHSLLTARPTLVRSVSN